MTDLVQKLVGALERLLPIACDSTTHPELSIEILDARAALSAAKDGGWVAVPGAVYEDGSVSLIRRGTEDERCRNRGSVRLYAPLPNPPKGEM